MENWTHPAIVTFIETLKSDFENALDALVAFCGISMFGNSIRYSFTEGGIELSVYTRPVYGWDGEREGSVPPTPELVNAVNALAEAFGFKCSKWVECEKGWGTFTLTLVDVKYKVFVNDCDYDPKGFYRMDNLKGGQWVARKAQEENPGARVRLARHCSR